MELETYQWTGAIAKSVVLARPSIEEWLDHVPSYARDTIDAKTWDAMAAIDWGGDVAPLRTWLDGVLAGEPVPDSARLIDIELGDFLNNPPSITIMAHDTFQPDEFQFGIEGAGVWSREDTWYELAALAKLVPDIIDDDGEDEPDEIDDESEVSDEDEKQFFAISGLALAHTTLIAVRTLEEALPAVLAEGREPLHVIAGIHGDDPVLIGTIGTQGWKPIPAE